ncbi:MAG TPA: Slp family lipoprotein [Nitrospiria bacterium]
MHRSRISAAAASRRLGAVLGWTALAVGLAILPAGCGPALSKAVRAQVDLRVTFKEVFKDPEAHKGKVVLWGGEIILIHNAKDVTWIEMLQRPLSGEDRPQREGPSEGRFLIRHAGFLDAAVYAPGRELSVAGTIEGKRQQPLGEIEYSYPVLSDKELVLWNPRGDPAYHFGVGLGLSF